MMAENKILSEPNFFKGIEQFNNHDFFDAHDTLEEIWQHFRGRERKCLQGIIQLAIGYYHFCFGNLKGAESMLNKGLEKIQQYPPDTFEINVGELAEQTEFCLSELEKIKNGEYELKNFDVNKIPKIKIL